MVSVPGDLKAEFYKGFNESFHSCISRHLMWSSQEGTMLRLGEKWGEL